MKHVSISTLLLFNEMQIRLCLPCSINFLHAIQYEVDLRFKETIIYPFFPKFSEFPFFASFLFKKLPSHSCAQGTNNNNICVEKHWSWKIKPIEARPLENSFTLHNSFQCSGLLLSRNAVTEAWPLINQSKVTFVTLLSFITSGALLRSSPGPTRDHSKRCCSWLHHVRYLASFDSKYGRSWKRGYKSYDPGNSHEAVRGRTRVC